MVDSNTTAGPQNMSNHLCHFFWKSHFARHCCTVRNANDGQKESPTAKASQVEMTVTKVLGRSTLPRVWVEDNLPNSKVTWGVAPKKVLIYTTLQEDVYMMYEKKYISQLVWTRPSNWNLFMVWYGLPFDSFDHITEIQGLQWNPLLLRCGMLIMSQWKSWPHWLMNRLGAIIQKDKSKQTRIVPLQCSP